MRFTKMAFALAAVLPASLLAGPGSTKSADSMAAIMGTHPAVVRYVSNGAPFVVFDVSPRSVAGLPPGFNDITLSFIATDALRQFNVFPYVTSARDGSTRSANRVACGAREYGYGTCAVPARELLAGMERGEGLLGLRVEVTGEGNDHSTIVITLPVRGMSDGRRPAPATPPRAPTPL